MNLGSSSEKMEFKIVFEILISLIVIAYFFMMLRIFKGWLNIESTEEVNSPTLTFSIIIPFRNEREKLPALLKSILRLNYDVEYFQLIFVDDDSTDDSHQIVSDFIEVYNLKAILLHTSGGKKKAIIEALNSVSNEIVLFLDADTVFEPNILNSYCNKFQYDGIKLVAGPVQFKNSETYFGNFVELEFISLVISGAGAIGAGNPIMINGANYAVRRHVFTESVNEIIKSNIASGDDIFVLHHVKNYYGSKAIMFNKAKDSIVTTEGPGRLMSFMKQRIRWTGKSKFYEDFEIAKVSLIVLLTNMALAIYPIYLATCFSARKTLFYLAVLAFKVFIDKKILDSGIAFFGKTHLKGMIIISSIIYPFYVVLIGILGQILPVVWKDRIVNPTGRLARPRR